MTDIVQQLRRDATCTSHYKAADEIERLRAALRLIAMSWTSLGLPIAWYVAQRALQDGWDVRTSSICWTAVEQWERRLAQREEPL